MAKKTINIDKVEDVDTDLLERGLTTILAELRHRCYKVQESCLDRENNVGAEQYKKRYEEFRKIETIINDMPGRIEWVE